jgi:hypothetical protein
MEPTAKIYRAALLDISGVSVEVVFVDSGFDQKTPVERRTVCGALRESVEQSASTLDIVLVWQDAAGRMKFAAPPWQERFFQAMRYDQLYAQADRAVTVTLA